jgi:hypothetical protein
MVLAMKRKTESIDDRVPSTPFLAKYHELFDTEDLWAAARQSGAVERQRKVDLPALVEASVLALSGLPGTQTTIFANYLHLGGATVAPSAFYDRFTAEFATLMGELAERAVLAVRAIAPKDALAADLTTLLEHFRDVRVIDSTCMVLQKLAACWAPSTSKERPAGFKLHSVVSLLDGLPVEHHVSPQREHDNRHVDESALTPGTLFMADLGYVDEKRVVRLVDQGVHVLMRLKKSQNPRIERVRVGRGDRRACRGMRLDEAFAEGLLDFDRRQLDLDVVIEAGAERRILRVVGTSEGGDYGDCWFYLTSVPRDVLTPENVSVAYTLRWDIELLWKHLKTGTGMSAIRAWKQEAVTALVNAKLIGLALARLLELSVLEETKDHAMGQMAIVLTLNRMVPLIIAMRLRERGVSLAEMERRMLTMTLILARSRRQRRDRAKKKERTDLRRDH